MIDYRKDDIAEAITDWAPQGLDYLMDAAGVSTLPQALDLVRPGGTYVSIPTLVDDGDAEASLAAAAEKGVKRVFSMMDDTHCAGTLQKIAELVAGEEIQLPPLREFTLRDVARAHEIIQRGHTRGKIVLKVADLQDSAHSAR